MRVIKVTKRYFYKTNMFHADWKTNKQGVSTSTADPSQAVPVKASLQEKYSQISISPTSPHCPQKWADAYLIRKSKDRVYKKWKYVIL